MLSNEKVLVVTKEALQDVFSLYGVTPKWLVTNYKGLHNGKELTLVVYGKNCFEEKCKHDSHAGNVDFRIQSTNTSVRTEFKIEWINKE